MKQNSKLSIFFIIAIVLSTTSAYASSSEIRGLWVVRYSITTPQKIDSLLQFANQLNFTDLYVQVRGRGDAYYNSRFEPKALSLTDPTFDPLAYLIKQNKYYNFRIHAWVNAFYVWSADTLPDDRNHVVHRGLDWLARPFNQKNLIDNYPTSVRQAHSEGIYVSPMNPEAQQNLTEIVFDIIENYQVDGVHLDYIRYPNNKFDFHPDVVKRFKRRHVLDPNQFFDKPQKFVDTFSVAGYEVFSLSWRNYLMDGLSSFIQNLSKEIKDHSRDLIVSAAVKPDITIAHWDFYQHWDRWVKEKWLTYAVPMNYTPDVALFQNRINDYLEKLPPERYLVGIALYNQGEPEIIRKLARVESLKNAGFVLFSYSQIKKQHKVQEYLKNGLEGLTENEE